MITIRCTTPLALLALCASCTSSDPVATTSFTGATVWDGTGSAAMADATIVVREGRVVSVEAGGAIPRGSEVVSLAGRYVIPGLVNAHGHVSGLWANDSLTDGLERVRGDLELFARYGVTTVNSLGDDEVVLAARDAAAPTDPRARLLAAGPVIAEYEPAAARAAATANADAGVDWLKLRVDDNLGTSEKMPWDAVQAVVDVSRERGIPLATHLFYLDDAKRLLGMGTGLVAHSVRDTDVDFALIAELRTSGVCYVPTLTREVSTFVYAERPDFFDDPFFTEHAHSGEVERVSQPDFMERMSASPAAAGYRVALDQAMRNLAALSDGGVRIAMGTDAGPAGRFPGYFEHLEMWMMADAGMTPSEVLRSATAVAAECAHAGDVGTLEPGKWADFLVLSENPLEDVRATRSLERVFVAGRPVR